MDSDITNTQEYMSLLLEAGIPAHEVLEKGLHFVFSRYHYGDTEQVKDWNTSQLYAATVLNQAAKNLKIDAESQERAARMQSREIEQMFADQARSRSRI